MLFFLVQPVPSSTQHRKSGGGFAGRNPVAGTRPAGNNAELAPPANRQTSHRKQSPPSDLAEVRELQDALGFTKVFSGEEGLIKLATHAGSGHCFNRHCWHTGFAVKRWRLSARGRTSPSPRKKSWSWRAKSLCARRRRTASRVLAVDSEHSAIFQCLEDKPPGVGPRLMVDSFWAGCFWPMPKAEFCRHHCGARAQASVVGDGPQDHD